MNKIIAALLLPLLLPVSITFQHYILWCCCLRCYPPQLVIISHHPTTEKLSELAVMAFLPDSGGYLSASMITKATAPIDHHYIPSTIVIIISGVIKIIIIIVVILSS